MQFSQVPARLPARPRRTTPGLECGGVDSLALVNCQAPSRENAMTVILFHGRIRPADEWRAAAGGADFVISLSPSAAAGIDANSVLK